MNVIVIFTDKIMSLAIPVKEMLDQYSMAIKEMAKYIEETYKDSSNEEMSLDEFLDDMDKETRLLDSDVTGMLSN
jgi:two-component sensor histidine kinase